MAKPLIPLILSFVLLSVGICVCGCSKEKPEVELTPGNISELEFSILTKVSMFCINRNKLYQYAFTIPPEKGHSILRWIMDANQLEFDDSRLNRSRIGKEAINVFIVFETRKKTYTTRIAWNDESSYGYWWESKDLLNVFRGWGLTEGLAKADPNWPPHKWMTGTLEPDTSLPASKWKPKDPNRPSFEWKYPPEQDDMKLFHNTALPDVNE